MLVIRKLQINAHLALCIIYELAAKKIGSKASINIRLVDLFLILAKLLINFLVPASTLYFVSVKLHHCNYCKYHLQNTYSS